LGQIFLLLHWNGSEFQTPATIVISTKETKRQQEFNTLRGKVLTLKEQNKTKEQMSVPELKLMVRWYKQSGDLPVPQTRQALITRFDDTNHRGDQ
jgi:hypothetical protein